MRKTYEMSPFQRGQVEGLEGKAGPAFPGSQSSWDVRLHNRGWESGASKRMQFQAQLQAAMRNDRAKRSSLDDLLPADDLGYSLSR